MLQVLQPDEACALAESGFHSLPYHLHLDFVTEFINFYSYLLVHSLFLLANIEVSVPTIFVTFQVLIEELVVL